MGCIDVQLDFHFGQLKNKCMFPLTFVRSDSFHSDPINLVFLRSYQSFVAQATVLWKVDWCQTDRDRPRGNRPKNKFSGVRCVGVDLSRMSGASKRESSGPRTCQFRGTPSSTSSVQQSKFCRCELTQSIESPWYSTMLVSCIGLCHSTGEWEVKKKTGEKKYYVICEWLLPLDGVHRGGQGGHVRGGHAP